MQGPSRLEGYGGFRKTVQRDQMGRYKCSLSLVGKDCAAKENHDGHRLQGSMLQPAKWMEECWVVVSGVAIARRTPGGRRKGRNWRLRAHVCGHKSHQRSTEHRERCLAARERGWVPGAQGQTDIVWGSSHHPGPERRRAERAGARSHFAIEFFSGPRGRKRPAIRALVFCSEQLRTSRRA